MTLSSFLPSVHIDVLLQHQSMAIAMNCPLLPPQGTVISSYSIFLMLHLGVAPQSFHHATPHGHLFGYFKC